MINLHESYVVELGFELATPGFSVRHATDCAMEPGYSSFERNYSFTFKECAPSFWRINLLRIHCIGGSVLLEYIVNDQSSQNTLYQRISLLRIHRIGRSILSEYIALEDNSLQNTFHRRRNRLKIYCIRGSIL